MGFRPPPANVVNLDFADGAYAGAVVKCSLDASVGMILDVIKGSWTMQDLGGILAQFGDDFLIEWNVEDGAGNPRPPTGESMQRLPNVFAIAILSAWADALIGVPAPLGEPSSNGAGSVVPPIPMETL